jgi:predicted GNAT family acetyltransferase
MSARVTDSPESNRYELFVDDELVGRADYRLSGDRLAIVHVEVDRGGAGRGLGKTLVEAVLADARQRGLGVLPYCPFARKVIADEPEAYLDLVPADARERFALPPATAEQSS